MIRLLREEDIEVLREIHCKARYGFDFPDLRASDVAYVLEHQGRTVGCLAAELHAELTGIFDPSWGSPHERLKTFTELHIPVAEQLKRQGVKRAYVMLDPQFPRFGRRLMQLGWKEALWRHYHLSVEECLGRAA